MFMVSIEAKEESTIKLKDEVNGEVAIVVVEGEITEANEKVSAGQMLISKSDEACEICIPKGTKLLLFGGEAFLEERYLLWNFASSSKERLQKARSDWENKLFPKVAGDETYIPIPV